MRRALLAAAAALLLVAGATATLPNAPVIVLASPIVQAPANVLVLNTGSQCPSTCRYDWVFTCDKQVIKVSNRDNVTLTTGPRAQINTFGYSIINCNVNLTSTVTGLGAPNVVSLVLVQPVFAFFFASASPTTVDTVGGTPVSLGATSKCGLPPCAYSWAMTCAGYPKAFSKVVTVTDTGSPGPATVTTGWGRSYEINLSGKAPGSTITCVAALTAKDGNGVTAAAASNVTVTITVPDMEAVLSGVPANVTAGDRVPASGAGSTCPGGGCSYSFSVDCGVLGTFEVNSTTSDVNITSGYRKTIDTDGMAPEGANCTVMLKLYAPGGTFVCSNTSDLYIAPGPPICGDAVASPDAWRTTSRGKACAAKDAYRTNTTDPATGLWKGGHLVTVPAFFDPQGYASNVTITAVNTNRAPFDCGRCRPSPKNANCTPACVPDAFLNAGGTEVVVLDQQTLSAPAGTGRVYRLIITAVSSGTNMTCSGYTDVCLTASGAGRCKDYDVSGIDRDATICGP